MLQNYLKIALRNFSRQPAYTFLNIMGLAIGIAASLFILLYVRYELSYDQYHTKADRIYRISSDIREPDNAFKWSVTQNPLGRQLKQDYEEVEEYVRLNGMGKTLFRLGDDQFFIEKVFIADSTIFDVFTFDFVMGDPSTALNQPNAMVLSETEARRFFGESDPIGKLLQTTRPDPYMITGVYRDMPTNSHLIAEALISARSFGPDNNNPGAWGSFNLYTYVLLREGADPASFASKLPDVIEKFVAVIFDQFGITIEYKLLPLTDIHLTSDFAGEPEPTGTMTYIYIFLAVGFFLLLIASINYMNLATARSARRALEVGLRKVLGSHRSHLIAQFLAESMLLTLGALLVSILLLVISIPFLNELFDLHLQTSSLIQPSVIVSILGIVLLVGFVGGSYPAFYLSRFMPVTVLKGKLSSAGSNTSLRRILVITQFVITIFMLIGTGVIYDQLQYVRSKDLGFDKEHVLTFSVNGNQFQKWDVLYSELSNTSDVVSVGISSTTPGNGYSKQLMNVETNEGMEQYGVDNYSVDFDFFPTMGIKVVEGRNFSREFSTDSTQAVMVNEAFVRRLGWDDPIGKKVQLSANDTLPFYYVIGVVEDFHQQSLYNEIAALLFAPRFGQFSGRIVHVRLNGGKIKQAIAEIETKWRSVFPTTPFEYRFVDERFQMQYEEDERRGRIFLAFSFLTIFITCLGLLGLTSFTVEQRRKEISVRRVVGAETRDILYLLTKHFAILVAIAAIPAFAAGWFVMREWLESFAYHADMNYLLYIGAFLGTMLITLLTTGYHALKAAKADPVHALKYE
ncbi:MAG: ABC transporter permease [Bacteroidota bacterium]